MTGSQATPNSDLDQALVHEAEAALVEAFGHRFELWAPGDPWYRVSVADPTAASDPPDCVAELLQQSSVTRAGPVLLEQNGKHHLLAIPICRSGKARLIATAKFHTTAPELLMKLAELFLREFDQREQLQRHRAENEAYIAEITQNYEELVFLRRVALSVDLSELAQDRWKPAETVLPVLCNSIKAESIVLLPTKEDSESGHTADTEVGQPTLWIGPHSTDAQTCQRLVEQYRHRAAEQPVVMNSLHETSEEDPFPGVRNFLLVAMSTSGRVNGWLLALNRVVPQELEPQTGRCDLSQREFGTVEAGSVSSAGSMLSAHARNVELFEQKSRLVLGAIHSLVSAIDAKDQYTSGHSERVALFARRLGQELGLSEEACQRLYLAGLLHDVGKIGISGSVLRKPGRLTDEESSEMQQHPERAWVMLHDLEHVQPILPGILHHHERYDGQGYPDGMAGEEIPLDARILAVADAYDAMTVDRPYRKGMPQEEVEAILRDGAGTQWDPRAVEAAFQVMPEFVQIRESYRGRARPRRIPNAAAVPLMDTPQISSEMQSVSEP